MMLNISNPINLFMLLFILFMSNYCSAQKKDFNFTGRLVLFSDSKMADNDLILLNIDTNEKMSFTNFNGVDKCGYLLFDSGKKILINAYNSLGKIFIYEIETGKRREIDLDRLNNEIHGFSNTVIRNDTLYFTFREKLFIYSLPDFNKISELSFTSNIADLAIFNRHLVALTFSNFDFATTTLIFSQIYFYDLNKQVYLDSVSEIGHQLKWKQNKTDLFALTWDYKPILLDYPSLKKMFLPKENNSLIFSKEMFFVDDDTIVLIGYNSSEGDDNSDLYLYSIRENIVLKKLTNSSSNKEIKSTSSQ